MVEILLGKKKFSSFFWVVISWLLFTFELIHDYAKHKHFRDITYKDVSCSFFLVWPVRIEGQKNFQICMTSFM